MDKKCTKCHSVLEFSVCIPAQWLEPHLAGVSCSRTRSLCCNRGVCVVAVVAKEVETYVSWQWSNKASMFVIIVYFGDLPQPLCNAIANGQHVLEVAKMLILKLPYILVLTLQNVHFLQYSNVGSLYWPSFTPNAGE